MTRLVPGLKAGGLMAMLSGCVAGCQSGPSWGPAASNRIAADGVLDDFHDAAAKADEARYFGHFAKDGVFLGTDATERWTTEEFHAWAKPYFAKGTAWTYTPTKRNLTVSDDGATAWFDEDLQNAKMGHCRGSGVLVREGGAWKVSQYNLSVPVPNELMGKVVEMIRAK